MHAGARAERPCDAGTGARAIEATPIKPDLRDADDSISIGTLSRHRKAYMNDDRIREAGQYVSTGAATDPQPVRAGSVVRARFGRLGAIDIELVD